VVIPQKHSTYRVGVRVGIGFRFTVVHPRWHHGVEFFAPSESLLVSIAIDAELEAWLFPLVQCRNDLGTRENRPRCRPRPHTVAPAQNQHTYTHIHIHIYIHTHNDMRRKNRQCRVISHDNQYRYSIRIRMHCQRLQTHDQSTSTRSGIHVTVTSKWHSSLSESMPPTSLQWHDLKGDRWHHV
jgi:hypothetical protein